MQVKVHLPQNIFCIEESHACFFCDKVGGELHTVMTELLDRGDIASQCAVTETWFRLTVSTQISVHEFEALL